MPDEPALDATSRNTLAGALIRSSTAALNASNELLAHYGDTGDGPTQRAVETLLEGAADALRALTDSMADSSLELEHRV